ncbi:hypothetical protein hbim_01706 [Mycolicibacterium mageritense]|uniref:Uncharacterized protein n=1 Tax=Mycolicibacterium mageritense TaxID=53462 RepID=A0AAI8TRU1_MYCME|nr:hypothetical protein hbim_01706 [Mycolicibacterium mageritense]
MLAAGVGTRPHKLSPSALANPAPEDANSPSALDILRGNSPRWPQLIANADASDQNWSRPAPEG